MNKKSMLNYPEVYPIVPNSMIKVSHWQSKKNDIKEKRKPSKLIHHVQNESAAKVLIIGSGNRIYDNYIPALKELTWPIDVIGLWSRNTEHAEKAANAAGWPLIPMLSEKQVTEADIIIISITSHAVPSIVKNLINLADCSDKSLVIDTPVFSGLKQSLFSPWLNTFKSVVVTEDYMNFPQFEIIRHYLNQNLIGTPLSVEIQNIGYLYHGLALGRSFLGFPEVKSSYRTNQTTIFNCTQKKTISIIGPYKQREGEIRIIGTHGEFIYRTSNCEVESQRNKKDAPLILTEQWDKQAITGLSLSIEGSSLILPIPQIGGLTLEENPFNYFKTIGLVSVLNSLFEKNINTHYNYQEALCDNFISSFALRKVSSFMPDYRLFMRYLEVLSLACPHGKYQSMQT
jgi:hypothetical protein